MLRSRTSIQQEDKSLELEGPTGVRLNPTYNVLYLALLHAFQMISLASASNIQIIPCIFSQFHIYLFQPTNSGASSY